MVDGAWREMNDCNGKVSEAEKLYQVKPKGDEDYNKQEKANQRSRCESRFVTCSTNMLWSLETEDRRALLFQ